MSFFKNLFKKSAPAPPVDFKVLDADRNALPSVSILKIQQQEVNGIIVRNFLSQETCATLSSQFEQQLANESLPLDQSRIYPSSFAQLDRNSKHFEAELKQHFDDSEAYVNEFPTRFGFDLLGEITGFVESMSPGSTVKVPPGIENGCYLPGTFRVQCPDAVNIHLHCGNQFLHLFPKYYDHLSSMIEVYDQLSYFVMLQQPDSGGRLILYDITWDEAQECTTSTNTIKTLKGKSIDLNSDKVVQHTKLSIGTGDLLIFAGGQQWHAVEQVTGNTNRITFGGFLGFEKEKAGQDLYWWS